MEVIVVGGGAAGMMAAITCARENDKNKVTILEKTSNLGNKIKITGKGRCNITFVGDRETFKENITKNYRFLYSSFSEFDNKDVAEFFEKLGVKTKVERGGRVFPVSDDAKQVVLSLEKEIKRLKINVKYNSKVKALSVDEENKITGVVLESGEALNCDKCIIATGGKSYSVTGSAGDGYKLLASVGHNIIEPVAGLIPIKSSLKICKNAQGLTLKNVKLSIKEDSKVIAEEFGEMLFAHFGITGPIVLSLSSKINRVEDVENKMKAGNIYGSLDLKPALNAETLDKRIQRDFEKYNNKEFKNSLVDLLPSKIIPEIVRLSGIDENKKVHQITKEERKKLVNLMKDLKIDLDGFMNIDMAIITCGGVDVKEINPKTMESKLIKGLHVCGEVLDLDALTGGFNLQIAFSTGYAAGKN